MSKVVITIVDDGNGVKVSTVFKPAASAKKPMTPSQAYAMRLLNSLARDKAKSDAGEDFMNED